MAEFQRLPLAVKDHLRTRAGKKATEAIKRAFAEGKIWVLLCGSSTQVRASARTPDEVLSDEKLMEFARIQQRAPFQFYRPVTVDDGWSPCGISAHTRYYPTVALELNRNRVQVHFDTGSPMTLFSYDELLRLDVIRPTSNFAEAFRNGGFPSYWATPLAIQAELRCQRSGETQTVVIRGQAVREWEASPYRRVCDASCPAEIKAIEIDGLRLCPDRIALVGRNLLIENALIIILDGKTRTTAIGKEKE